MIRVTEWKEPGSIDKIDTSKESRETGMKIEIINEASLTGTTIVPQPHETTELQEVAILLADALILLARLDTGGEYGDKFQVAVTVMERLQRAQKRIS